MTPTLQSELRAALLAKRKSLRGPTRQDIEIARFADPIDQTTADGLREQAEREASRVDAQIRLIDAALERMKDGDYAVCPDCGELISEKRLRAVPWALYCIACANQRERKKEGYSDLSVVDEAMKVSSDFGF